MDTNTMIVRLVEALLCFAFLCLLVLRLDRLWLRMRHFQLHVPGWIKASVRFFKEEPRNSVSPPRVMKLDGRLQGSYEMASNVRAILCGDQCDIDWMVITHPDDDHWDVLKTSHHGRR